jgi:hypothetical protein
LCFHTFYDFTRGMTKPFIPFQPTIPLHWDRWMDDLAGIGSYTYVVFTLGNDGSSLSEDQGKKVADGYNISNTDVSVCYHCFTSH